MKAKNPSTGSKGKPAKAQLKIRDIKPQKDARGGRTADPCEGGELKPKLPPLGIK